MAKVTGPLMSMDARGQLGKTLVYLGWKGLKTVRTFVVPANPKTAGQTGQRTLMSDGVDGWHDTRLTGADKTAWDRFAKTLSSAMSGFNAFVRQYINVDIAGKTWVLMFGGAEVSEVPETQDFEINTTTGIAVSMRYGGSPSSLINTEAMAEDEGTGKYEKSIAGLVTGEKTYVQFYVTTDHKLGSESGIYEFVVP